MSIFDSIIDIAIAKIHFFRQIEKHVSFFNQRRGKYIDSTTISGYKRWVIVVLSAYFIDQGLGGDMVIALFNGDIHLLYITD